MHSTVFYWPCMQIFMMDVTSGKCAEVEGRSFPLTCPVAAKIKYTMTVTHYQYMLSLCALLPGCKTLRSTREG
jgi:hypothetical protein